jgi:uncharacterized membrane protein
MKALQPLRRWGKQLRWSVSFIAMQAARGLFRLHTHRFHRLIYALIIANMASVTLFCLRLIGAENFRYWFMLWNLILAWIAPLLAWYLTRRLLTGRWRHWSNIVLTVLWLGFLPNSFYMVSDLIHVQQTGEVSIIFDAVLFTSFIFNGFVAGFLGAIMVHRELLRRLSSMKSYTVMAGAFFLSSYAIYLGRILRWNTWDAILHPSGLIFDVSDTILRPLEHPQAFVVTLSFTLLISSFYFVAWELYRAFIRKT